MAFEKLTKLINAWHLEGKKPHYASQSDMETLFMVYVDLCKNKKAMFLQDNIRKMLIKCGFTVKPYNTINYLVELH